MKTNRTRTMTLLCGLFIASLFIFSCQKNSELSATSEESQARSIQSNKIVDQTALSVDESVTLTAPTTVNVGQQFEIKAEVECGRIAIERGYILDQNGVKVYKNLNCSSSNLLWETLVDFECYVDDAKWDGSIAEPGTYVFRTKHNAEDAGCDGTQQGGGQGGPQPDPQGDCSFNGNEFSDCFMVEVTSSCETSFEGEAISCGSSREAIYTFKTKDAVEGFKIQGGLTNFTGTNATVYINDELVDFNSTSTDGWNQGIVNGYTVGQRTPGSGSNRNIRVEGSLASCGELKIRIVWNSSNTGVPITGDWSVKDSNGVELAPSVAGLTCQ